MSITEGRELTQPQRPGLVRPLGTWLENSKVLVVIWRQAKNCSIMAVASRYSPLIATLGQELFDKVHGSKILLIGAGGIGCEVIRFVESRVI